MAAARNGAVISHRTGATAPSTRETALETKENGSRPRTRDTGNDTGSKVKLFVRCRWRDCDTMRRTCRVSCSSGSSGSSGSGAPSTALDVVVMAARPSRGSISWTAELNRTAESCPTVGATSSGSPTPGPARLESCALGLDKMPERHGRCQTRLNVGPYERGGFDGRRGRELTGTSLPRRGRGTSRRSFHDVVNASTIGRRKESESSDWPAGSGG